MEVSVGRSLAVLICSLTLASPVFAAQKPVDQPNTIQLKKDGKNFKLQVDGRKRSALKLVSGVANDLIEIYLKGGVPRHPHTGEFSHRTLGGDTNAIDAENVFYQAILRLSKDENKKTVVTKVKKDVVAATFTGDVANDLMDAMFKADLAVPQKAAVELKTRSKHVECASSSAPKSVATCTISVEPLPTEQQAEPEPEESGRHPLSEQ
jgi:hypothetical protein